MIIIMLIITNDNITLIIAASKRLSYKNDRNFAIKDVCSDVKGKTFDIISLFCFSSCGFY